ncbi:MAG: alpha/beta hydrolase, partial [Gammaproteobacteria bacterium]|nr:alpha/beta hydrolase [Gammaproteobacteria bacterium]
MIQTLKVPGTPAIAVNQTGEGPLTVLLHGIGGNKSNWTSQLSALAPHFKTIAWDARGYGDSDDY